MVYIGILQNNVSSLECFWIMLSCVLILVRYYNQINIIGTNYVSTCSMN